MTRTLQAIVLDYDGVVADTEPLHLGAMEQALSALGIRLTPDDYYEQYLGLDDEAVFRTLAADRGLQWAEDTLGNLLADKTARFAESLTRRCAATPSADGRRLLFPAVASRLREWSQTVPLAIASGSLHGEIVQVLDAEGLRGTISAIVAAGETPRGKPSPDPYLRALELLGRVSSGALVPSRCVAVEDSPWGIESAHGAGLAVVAVATSYPAGRLREADLVVDRFEELQLCRLEKVVCNSLPFRIVPPPGLN